MPTSANLRPATHADHERLRLLLTRSYGTLLTSHYSQTDLERVLPLITEPQPALLDSQTFYVIDFDGVLAACGGWTNAAPGTGAFLQGIGHIRHIAADPDYLRRGFASAILTRCRRDAIAAGLEKLSCWSTLQAEAFYRRQGFVRQRVVDVPLAPRTTIAAVEMFADL